jgi:hypothetical protein
VRLVEVEAEGYRSIEARLRLVLDPAVTVLLGANDHGKTNLLEAIQHLNSDFPFQPEDLNWNHREESAALPRIAFTFELSADDRGYLLGQENDLRIAEAAGAAASLAEGEPAAPAVAQPLMVLEDVPQRVVFERSGVSGSLIRRTDALARPEQAVTIAGWLPRAELIRPAEHIPDAVTSTELDAESHDFMRGIFYYAGLDPREWPGLFDQNDATQMRLHRASAMLNATLRASWTQAASLRFTFGITLGAARSNS